MSPKDKHSARAAILRRIDDAPNAEAAEVLRRELESLDAAPDVSDILAAVSRMKVRGEEPTEIRFIRDPEPENRDPGFETAAPGQPVSIYTRECARCSRAFTTSSPFQPLCGVCSPK